MKKSIEMRALLAILVVFLVTGCATSLKQHADGTWTEAITVADGPDRSATIISTYSADAVDKNGKLLGAKLLKPRDLAVGPTVAGQAAVAAVGGVTTAATQGIFGIQIAKETAKACRDGKCGGNGTVIYNNGKAEALSLSESGAKAAVNVSGGGTCTTGPCLAR